MQRPPPRKRVVLSIQPENHEANNKRKLDQEESDLVLNGPGKGTLISFIDNTYSFVERKKMKAFVDEILPNPPIVIVQYPLKKPRMIFWR
jgi:hypothetical protein